MSKVYTAREMRQAANAEELVGRPAVAAMLRQAADDFERKKRMKHEYAVKWLDEDSVANNMGERRDFAESVVRAVGESKTQLVSREVGEWEVCK